VKYQRGTSLMMAVVFITIIAMLAAFAVTIGGARHQQGNLDVLTDRAVAAARSGAEWGLRRAVANGLCAANSAFALNEGALAGFQVRVTCTAHGLHNDGVNPAFMTYDIQSTASWGAHGQPDYVRRTVVVAASTP
jgi:hypothetical protein